MQVTVPDSKMLSRVSAAVLNAIAHDAEELRPVMSLLSRNVYDYEEVSKMLLRFPDRCGVLHVCLYHSLVA